MAGTRAALVSICHGAGPLPALQDPAHASMIRHMSEDLPKFLKLHTPQAPKAIILLTAHWQTRVPEASSGTTHELIYDFYGFPEAGYHLKYKCDGAPKIAKRATELLNQQGFDANLDPTRGWDHGTFIPMKLINPSGSVPIVQMSVLSSQNASELLRMGAALAPLRDENVAIIGSGCPSYHNIRTWFSPRDANFAKRQAEWNEALTNSLQLKSAEERLESLENWRTFPHSFEMHPPRASEHFSTLLVCAGAAGGADVHFDGFDLVGARQTTCWWD